MPDARPGRPPISSHVPRAPTHADQVAALDPLTAVWAAGTVIHRCYDVAWGSRDFSAGDAQHPGRFHPFMPFASTEPLPVLCGAGDETGALSETVFHGVPVRGLKVISYQHLRHRLVVALAPRRELLLVDLTSLGLRRLGLSRPELVESGPLEYPATAAWARALHAKDHRVDGLTWVSRQHDTSRALVLFGDRVSRDDLEVVPEAVPKTTGWGPGLELVAEVADRAGIIITGLDT